MAVRIIRPYLKANSKAKPVGKCVCESDLFEISVIHGRKDGTLEFDITHECSGCGGRTVIKEIRAGG